MRKSQLGYSNVGYLVALAIVAVAALGLVARTSAKVAGGGSHPERDCYVEFDGVDANPTTCTDCDPNCDKDGVATANGSCTFKIAVCPNQTDVAGCTSPGLKKLKAKGLAAPPSLTGSTCGAFTDVVVKLKKKGKKAGKKKIKASAKPIKQSGVKSGADTDTLMLVCNPLPAGQSCPSAQTTTTTSVTTTTLRCSVTGPCCGAERITLLSSAGTLRVDNLAAFPFPANVVTTMDSGPPNPADCSHAVVVGAGNFAVPHFDIPALNYCSEVIDKHCESGTDPAAPGQMPEGAGKLWDGHAAPACALTNVTKTADTSDGSCDTSFTGSNCNTTAGGAGANTLGNIDASRAQVTSGAAGVRSALDFRVTSRTWSDSVCAPAITAGCCVTSSYGDDTQGNGELLITLFDFILSPTTDTETAMFADQNSDGCSRAGSGFATPTPNSGTLTGVPAPGPCCVVGQTTNVVSVGVGFSGGAPLFDLGFASTIPNTVASCAAYPAMPATCTVTTDPCLN